MISKIYRVLFERERIYAVDEGDGLRRIGGNIFDDFRAVGSILSWDSVQVLCPVQPGKIIGVGFNYRDHAAGMRRQLPEEPLLFLKPPTAVIGPGDAIRLPRLSQRVEFEGELALVIGKPAKNVKRERALDYLLGLTCMNDVTARDIQAQDSQLTCAKGFDTFAPLGPCIACGLDPMALSITTRVNGQLRQSSSTQQLIFDVATIVAYISAVMTLLPGDVIATGTPAGTSPLRCSDIVAVELERIGVLENTVQVDPLTHADHCEDMGHTSRSLAR